MRIALIHALAESVAPTHAALASEWPDAIAFDLLDSSLAPDLAHTGKLDPAMAGRFRSLAAYAASSRGLGGSTAGILFTCSAFGPAIQAAGQEVSIPVLDPVSAAIDAAVAAGSRIGLILSFAPSGPPLRDALVAAACRAGRVADVRVVVADGALAALKSGDGATHDALVANAAATLPPLDVLLLGQFSLARAASAVARSVATPNVLTTPGCAVRALRNSVLSVARDGTCD